MNLNRIISIFIACFLWISSIGAQSYFQVLEDFTGQERNLSVLESASEQFIESFPQSYNDSIKVFEYDTYILTDNMYGSYTAEINRAQAKAESSSKYFVLYIFLSSSSKINFDVEVIVNLPNVGGSACFDSDFYYTIKGLIEKNAKSSINSPHLGLGIINGLSAGQKLVENKIKCCNGGTCEVLSLSELIATIEASGYVPFNAEEIFIVSEQPGGGVQGNAKVNLTFETFSTNMTLELQTFLQSSGGEARIREVNKSNLASFKINLLQANSYYDLIVINIDGKKQAYSKIKINVSPGFRSNAVLVPQVYYAIKFLAQVAVAAATDVLIQTYLEYWSEDHPSLEKAFWELEDGTVGQALKDGAVDVLLSIIPGLSKNEKAIYSGTYAVINYIIECSSNPSSFSMETAGTKFLVSGAMTYVFSGSNDKDIEKYAKKTANTVEKKGATYINKILDNDIGVKALAYFYKNFPSMRHSVDNVLLKMSSWNSNSNKVLFGPYDPGNPNSYEKIAGTKYAHFFLTKWDDIYKKIFGENRFYMSELNKKYVEEAVSRGKDIYFMVDPRLDQYAKTALQEVEWASLIIHYGAVGLKYDPATKFWKVLFN
ncbi:MAG: hypothetical protein IT265_05705 [Saprospiraceae bacterium]|nr:hypothetical protein [Saprospiraceae bacterium]